MGGPVIVKVREGVEFIPDAAAAFKRADDQCMREFGRGIDVNSTYRDYDKQLAMHKASVAYLNGTGPYPGHSYAAHPDISRHTNGTALDSDDWVNARIVQILAENGFIRNQLHVKGEDHHFEWLRHYDQNYGKEIDDMDVAQLDNALRWDVRRDGLGADAKNGPTIWNELGAIKNMLAAQSQAISKITVTSEVDEKALAAELVKQGITVVILNKE